MTKMPFPPFAAEESEAPETTPAEAAAPAEEAAPVKEKKARKKPNRQMTDEDIKFILENVRNMSYSEIAEARGLTKFQVNRVLMETKKKLREAAGDDEAKKAKVEEYIKTHLSRPEDSRPGGGRGRTSKVKSTIDSVVGDILSGL